MSERLSNEEIVQRLSEVAASLTWVPITPAALPLTDHERHRQVVAHMRRYSDLMERFMKTLEEWGRTT